MAVIDSRSLLSNKQSVTANGYSTHTLDLGSDRSIGVGTPLYVVVQPAADVTTAQTVTLESSKQESSSFSTLASISIPNGAKTGAVYAIGVPLENTRYLRLKYSAAGTITAYITDQQPSTNTPYPAV